MNTKKMEARDWLIDAAIALVVFAFGCLQLVLSSSSIIITDDSFRQMIGVINTSPSPFTFIAMAITTLPLVLRRKFSWPVFIFVMIAFLGLQDAFRGYSLVIVGPAVALYTVTYERNRNEAIVATVIAIVTFLIVMVPAQNVTMSLFIRIQNVTFLAVAALAGFAVRNYRKYVVETEHRAQEAEKSREEVAARRVEEERVRIAREIHDITAHSLSAISIQAAAAERLVEADPQAAETAIKTIRATSKEALEEIRSMIGVLRDGEVKAESMPTSGTERMGDLVTYLEDAGIAVDLDEARYDRSQVPSYIDIALFGIAREAVTNVMRHAQADSVTIRLVTHAGNAQLVVEDNGIGIGSDDEQDGHGLKGMAERAQILGGVLRTGNRTEAGFYVSVSIPFAETGKQYG